MGEHMVDDLMVWGDVESTGLDPVTDIMLEVGFRITDSFGNELHRISSLVWTPDWRSRLMRNEYVFDMHQKSGLVHELEDLSSDPQRTLRSREMVSRRMAEWIAEKTRGHKLPLAGNSVFLDKFFFHFHMPEVRDALHYRVIDVSSTREQLRLCNPGLFARLPEEPKAHRPQGDIDSSIKLWRWLQREFLLTAEEA